MLSSKYRWYVVALSICFLASCANMSQLGKRSKRLVKVDPVHQQQYEQALLAMKNKQYQRAEPIFFDLTQKQPGLSGPHANLGIIYYNTKRLSKAEHALKQATTLNPVDANIFNQLGVVYRTTGQFKAAEQAYLSAIKADSRYRKAYLNLGILYDLYLLEGEQALKYYKKYQSLSGGQDKKVKNWIADLNNRLKA